MMESSQTCMMIYDPAGPTCFPARGRQVRKVRAQFLAAFAGPCGWRTMLWDSWEEALHASK